MEPFKLFMVLLGCKPDGRFTEQHDIFFGIADSLKDLAPSFNQFWPEAKGKLHIDAWKEVTSAGSWSVSVNDRSCPDTGKNPGPRLFFLNLGGYKKDEFEEFHYKVLVVAENKADAITQAKQTAFYKHTGFEGAPSHIDDRYGVDVDDIYDIEDILPLEVKEKYSIQVGRMEYSGEEPEMHLGYLPLNKL